MARSPSLFLGYARRASQTLPAFHGRAYLRHWSGWALVNSSSNIAMAPRRGFTLVEILVVLIILGLAFTLAIPALFSPRDSEDATQRVVDAARHAAVRRASPAVLSIEPDGGWSLELASEREPGSGSQGQLDWPYEFAVRIHITPMGACILETASLEKALTIDPLRCRLAGE